MTLLTTKSFCALQTIVPLYGLLYNVNIQYTISYSYFPYNWMLLEVWEDLIILYFYHLISA